MKIHLGIKIEKKTHDALVARAKAEDRSVSALVRLLIKRGLETNT